MRSLCFWFCAGTALLAALIDPVWGYRVVFLLALSQIFMVAHERGHAFLLMHYVAVLIYFSLAPAVQIDTDTTFWGAGLLDTQVHQKALSILIAYLVGVELACLLAAPDGGPPAEQAPPPLTGFSLVVVTAVSLVAFASLFVRPDLNFIARGVVSDDATRPFELIVFSTLPKTLVLLGFVALAINALATRTVAAIAAALVALAAACAAGDPVNTARQIILVGLLPLAIYLLGRRHKLLLAALVFGAIAGLGPILNFVSRGSMYEADIAAFPTGPDFDAMYIVAGLLERAPSPEPGYGRYLLSAMSFMLPRDLKRFPDFDPLQWPSMGANFSQSNVSLPPFFTAYFDFGYFGPLLLGLAISRIFLAVERGLYAVTPSYTALLSSLVLCAAYIPFLRGPILGWGPFGTSGILSALIIGVFCSAPAARRLQTS